MKNEHDDDLWAIHIAGSVGLVAAPSFEEADQAVERFNRKIGVLDDDGVVIPGSPVYAEVDTWPHGAESHAHSIKKFWPEYAK